MNKDAMRLVAIAAVLIGALAVGARFYLRAQEEERAAQVEAKEVGSPRCGVLRRARRVLLAPHASPPSMRCST